MYFAVLNSFYGQETIDFMYLENQIITDNYQIFNTFCPYSGGIWYMVIFHSFYGQNICSISIGINRHYQIWPACLSCELVHFWHKMFGFWHKMTHFLYDLKCFWGEFTHFWYKLLCFWNVSKREEKKKKDTFETSAELADKDCIA